MVEFGVGPVGELVGKQVILGRADAGVGAAAAVGGAPLTDVGMVASYWSEVGELLWRSGRDLDHLDFYRALATFKLACVAEGVFARRSKSGETSRIADADAAVRSPAGLALEAASRLGG